jgi:GntR family transcriptional activator of glc operon
LRAREIIHTAQGKGSYVAHISKVDAGPLMHLFNSQPRTLYDLLEVRSLLEAESARLAAIRGTEADFIMIRRRYDEMVAAQGTATDTATICEASHNPVLVHTLQSLTDLLLGSVFACVNNLYHRQPEKRQIDRQHTRLFNAVTARQPEQARKAAADHVDSVRQSLADIEQEEQRLVRATLRLEGWS